jgi:hypothetical protein
MVTLMNRLLVILPKILILLLIVLCLLIWVPFVLVDLNMIGLHVAFITCLLLLVSYLVHKTSNVLIKYVQPLVAATILLLVLIRLINYRDILPNPLIGPTVTVWIPLWTRTFKAEEVVGLSTLFAQTSIIIMFLLILLIFVALHIFAFVKRNSKT